MSGYSDFLVWGNNQDNLLSKSATKCLTTPTPLSLTYDIISVSASEKHIVFLTKDGNIYSFGSNLDGRLGVSARTANRIPLSDPVKVPIPDRVIKIQCGFSHVCVLTENMELFSWGLGDYGALGIGEMRSKSTPTKVQLPKNIVTNIKQISCGAMHTAFLTQAGDVFMCGSNQYGELGISKQEKISTPTPISFHLQVQQISCGVFYTLLLTKQGKIYGMGNNKYGQLGIGHKVNQSHPTLVRDLDGIVKITAGYHSGAIDHSGNLYLWGSGSFGEFLKPKKFVLSVPIRDISIRGFFGLAIGHNSKYESRIYTWGNNTYGELGVGTYEAAQEPREVEPLRGVEARSISLGVNFAILALHGDRRPFQHPYRSPRIPEYSMTDRREVRKFDEQNAYSYTKNRSRSRQMYRPSPTLSYYQPTHRQINREVARQINSISQPIPPVIPFQSTYLSGTGNKNYQKLFLTLSDDYEILLKKYQELQKQLQIVNAGSATTRPTFDQESLVGELQYENKILKSEVTKLRTENQTFRIQSEKYRQECKKLLKQNQILIAQKKTIQLQHKFIKSPERVKVQQKFPKPPTSNYKQTEQTSSILIAELQSQYNKILTEKELLINQLQQTHKNREDQLYKIISKLKQQRNEMEVSLGKQKSKSKAERQSIRAQLEAINEELIKEKRKSLNVEEQVSKYRNQIQIQQENLKKYQILNDQLENSLMESERKYRMHGEEVLKKQLLLEKCDDLQMQLNYEKQFNKKYEGTVLELQQMRQKIYKELVAEIDLNKAHKLRIQEQKGEIETYKKYKKDADQKAILIEQIQQNFNNFKNKSDQMCSEKDEEINSLEKQIQNRNKVHADQLLAKDSFIEELKNTIHGLDKEVSKVKDSVAALKQQILLKDQELEHLSQSKVSLQKKVQYLQSQYQKQYEQRQRMGVQLGEIRRELSKVKITLNKINDELLQQKQKSSKLLTQLNLKQNQYQKLQQQHNKQKQKLNNLTKQNSMYREKIGELEEKLEQQMEINQELIRANQEFAKNQEIFTERIQELERSVKQLEDQNKSYTPRYEALILRNRELDERNRQLGEMINKAVEIQAQSYKNNILKQVQINTDQFLHDVNDEQTFKNRGKRNISKQLSKVEQEDLEFQSPLGSEELKVEPYTKMMKQRVSAHKRKVSESAYKLANLLNMNDRQTSRNLHKTEDYQQINSRMQNFSNQKQQFISKIHSYAEKLKIL